ncbi:methylenetetrahydrofolate reductase C-terminal domain-containing protein [Phorcysia thermohydrogeniphila]|uniref:Methylene-tetrahydrofolate reductase-like protein n=1 Tax=Phorcysia thermohydrogeniphila TaxID=936138 RepID=A0A4R1GE07_9BACT|nr:methylenetetrahydrofolate reductase C-terminal domain-containing protein [Phorcysia thermohydrogeniphila]TCK06384.1 methylene-tetrahydrofolate reductase-like protein [Phorcysia thermohydrogeniphila]
MVVVKLKPLEEILEKLRGFRRVFIFGCELGSGRCKNGGLREALKLAGKLDEKGFEIVGITSPGGTCVLEKVDIVKKDKAKAKKRIVENLINKLEKEVEEINKLRELSKHEGLLSRLLREYVLKEKEEHVGLLKKELSPLLLQLSAIEGLSKADVILSLACGAGTQLIAENVDIPVITGVTTLFIGAEREGRFFNEYCIACGDCIISDTGGICPIARCPKSLTNGPCGGAIEGQCEVDKELPCIWYRIAERMKKIGTFNRLKETVPLKDYSKSVYPRRLILEEKS